MCEAMYRTSLAPAANNLRMQLISDVICTCVYVCVRACVCERERDLFVLTVNDLKTQLTLRNIITVSGTCSVTRNCIFIFTAS